jgi:hypothetical protein
MSNPQNGEPGFDFGVCSSREVDKRLRGPPNPPRCRTLPGSSDETCPTWETQSVATLPTAVIPASSEHANLPAS